MRFVFVHWVYEDRGSAQDLANYCQVARAIGHEVVVYGPPDAGSFDYTLAVGSADAVIFIFEWTTALQRGDQIDWARLIAGVPRAKRVVIDCDGKYNDAISVVGDYNHRRAEEACRWIAECDALSDKICQPTLHPLRPNVRTFFFHAYNPAWGRPLRFDDKKYGMFYVGNNWFRWAAMRRFLQALEPIRDDVGPMGLTGYGWDSTAPWTNATLSEAAYECDPEYLRRLDVEVRPPIHFDRVIDTMGEGIVTPIIYRPLFDRLALVTCRTFETIAANTIPLFVFDAAFAEEIYGPAARALVLPAQRPQDTIRDVLRRPAHYAEIVAELRRHLSLHHSYAARLQQLIDIVEA